MVEDPVGGRAGGYLFPSPAEAWCPAGDDSTDGSAAAPDDDGKDDAKAEDLGELWGPPWAPLRAAGLCGTDRQPSPPWGPLRGGLECLQP